VLIIVMVVKLLVFFTHRKSHMGFQLVSKVVSSNVLTPEWRKFRYFARIRYLRLRGGELCQNG